MKREMEAVRLCSAVSGTWDMHVSAYNLNIHQLSEAAQTLIREIHHAADTHNMWRDADAVGAHLVDSVAIAAQRCNGMALRASREREMIIGDNTRRTYAAGVNSYLAFTALHRIRPPFPAGVETLCLWVTWLAQRLLEAVVCWR